MTSLKHDINLSHHVTHLKNIASAVEPRTEYGTLVESSGPIVRAILHNAKIGDVCELVDPVSRHMILAEVVAIKNHEAILCPYGPSQGLSVKTQIISTGSPLKVSLGEELLGSVLDAFGNPIDGRVLDKKALEDYPIKCDAISPMDRPLISSIFETGIHSLDMMNTIGEGQRIGIFGEAGSGKSQLLSMIARHAKFDVCVIGLIGERGREVREFLERQLPEGYRERCITVVSTSDKAPMERVAGAYTATTIAEYFRDQGRSVLLLMDSITRYARGLREVGLAAGEVATRRGFPASVFSEIPRLIERTGLSDKGSITAIYSILVEGDVLGDPINEEVQSLTDGHVVLSRDMAQAGDYPAIDILQSKSRIMDAIIADDHKTASLHIRRLISKYNEIELLLQVGEYKEGTDKLGDEAIRKHDSIKSFFRQHMNEMSKYEHSLGILKGLAGE